MKSPVNNKKEMELVMLEEGLSAYKCPESGGIFLPITHYTQWLSRQPETHPKLPSIPASPDKREIQDSNDAKICPESGFLMSRYRVGHGFEFYLDRSPTGSVWFDKGEWELLRERGCHDELLRIFTVSWQKEVFLSDKAKAKADFLEEKLGVELFRELEQLKGKLKDHPYKNVALAYLSQD